MKQESDYRVYRVECIDGSIESIKCDQVRTDGILVKFTIGANWTETTIAVRNARKVDLIYDPQWSPINAAFNKDYSEYPYKPAVFIQKA